MRNHHKRKTGFRSTSGTTIAEFGASLVVGLPLVMLILYAIIEASVLFSIRANLDNATRLAAQELINNYQSTGQTPSATNSTLPSSCAFDIPSGLPGYYFVKKTANQFTYSWTTTTSPKTVTVRVTYPTTAYGSGGLLPFPHPDPFGLGTKFLITTNGTFPTP